MNAAPEDEQQPRPSAASEDEQAPGSYKIRPKNSLPLPPPPPPLCFSSRGGNHSYDFPFVQHHLSFVFHEPLNELINPKQGDPLLNQ